jgi:acetoin utilization protein AcuC
MPSSIATINALPPQEKRAIYARFIPSALRERFSIGPDFRDQNGRSLLTIRGEPGSTDVILELRHQVDFPDPLLYAHLTDTVNGQIHVLLYVINDPTSPRFDVDRMPDGRPTRFGTELRNIEAEIAAMQFGLAPGQIRRGLRLLKPSIKAFEEFVSTLGHELFLVEPLYYHNAILFETYGFGYVEGRRFMQEIDAGFQPGGPLRAKLDGSTPFRKREFAESARGRSWAIHDGILGQPFRGVTMVKFVSCHAGVSTFNASQL